MERPASRDGTGLLYDLQCEFFALFVTFVLFVTLVL